MESKPDRYAEIVLVFPWGKCGRIIHEVAGGQAHFRCVSANATRERWDVTKYPQPTQDDLDAAALYVKEFNPFWWEVVQGLIGQLQHESRWEDYEAVREALDDLLVDDGLIDAEWVAAFDFTVSDGGFAVMPGERGQWASGDGWKGTSSGGHLGLNIYRDFSTDTDVLGFLIVYYNNTLDSYTKTLELALREEGSGDEMTWYSSTFANGVSNANLLMEGEPVQGQDRIRVKNDSAGGTNVINVRVTKLILWGNGADPF